MRVWLSRLCAADVWNQYPCLCTSHLSVALGRAHIRGGNDPADNCARAKAIAILFPNICPFLKHSWAISAICKRHSSLDSANINKIPIALLNLHMQSVTDHQPENNYPPKTINIIRNSGRNRLLLCKNVTMLKSCKCTQVKTDKNESNPLQKLIFQQNNTFSCCLKCNTNTFSLVSESKNVLISLFSSHLLSAQFLQHLSLSWNQPLH